GRAVDGRARRHRLVGHRHAVAVRGLGALPVGAVGLEVEPVAGGVERPLTADVRRRGDDGDALDVAAAEQRVSDAQTERRLAGGGAGARAGGRGGGRPGATGGGAGGGGWSGRSSPSRGGWPASRGRWRGFGPSHPPRPR